MFKEQKVVVQSGRTLNLRFPTNILLMCGLV